MDIWVVSALGILRTCCYEHLRSFYINICFHFSWVYTKEWNCRSYGNSVFNILKNSQTVSKVDATFHISTSSVYVSISPHPHHHLFLSVYLILAIPVGVKGYLIVALICISQWLIMLSIFS